MNMVPISSHLVMLVLACLSHASASVLPHTRDAAAHSITNAHIFAHTGLAIPDALSENVLTLGSHPNPDVFHSPARARLQVREAQRESSEIRKRWWQMWDRDRPTTNTVQSGGVVTNAVTGTIFSGVYPVVNVTWGNKAGEAAGGQTIVSYIDTGSSDTFAVSNRFVCQGLPSIKANTLSDDTLPTGGSTHNLTQASCNFGPLYDVDKGNFTNITSQELRVAYSPENEALNGSMVFAPITVGGLTVPRQQVAIVEEAVWLGDGVTSGLLGLSFPAVTSAVMRSSRGTDAPRFVQYDPFFTNLAKQGKSKQNRQQNQRQNNDTIAPVFTLAIDRVPPGTPHWKSAGALALGGLVPSSYYTGNFTSVPIETEYGILNNPNSGPSFYATTVQLVYGPPRTNISSAVSVDIAIKSNNLTTSPVFQTIVDSGTSPNFVPQVAAIPINSLFVPPARFNETLNYFVVDCDAKAPFVAYRIGGTTANGVTTGGVLMPFDPRDMIVRSLNGRPGYENVCFSSIANGGEVAGNLQVIGATWQRNYVVAYDQGRNMVHFANRRPY
ncbi:uncharacterized protein SPSK_09038 [Sporothrix schenckii 1099-18]|uniref:Peptidase A1 domain-containing protein n=1 Tax=Sporothrix schenckii 1099-18 TaxID=1397361 RepID=A0A0F2M5Q0_SPOSC|nr:uncharacterized protein SPSK_09038 [Sporothrix schenckii 1099-18]KJR84125.1 hypothetical protein SPSK_09038 [Sporothrix schenckii 1099-18]